jgi:hypothetical protein
MAFLSPLMLLPTMAIAWSTHRTALPQIRPLFASASARRPTALASSSDVSSPPVYNGPALQDPSEIVAGISLGELGLDLAIAPSTIAPGTNGLYAILSEGTERTTIPSLTLLCGYSREGTFATRDEGDKTVGFTLGGADTAVFYEKRLMGVLDALELAAKTKGTNQSCGLAGHALVQNEAGDVEVHLDDSPDFERYFVPAFLNQQGDDEEGSGGDEHSVQNLGQFCNDLAWSYVNPPKDKEEYDAASDEKNAVQLVWRLEFDPDTNCLVPTWPVSVTAKDISFENADEFMELGTRYGWPYWQATVDLEAMY